MDGVQRERREVHQIHMPVQPAVQAEVAQVRGHAVLVRRVVAQHGDRHAALRLRWPAVADGLGDVEDKFVIAALVGPNQFGPHPQRGRLAGTLEVQQRPSLGRRDCALQAASGTTPRRENKAGRDRRHQAG